MKPSIRQRIVYSVAAIVFVAFMFLPQSLEDASLLTGVSVLSLAFAVLCVAVSLVNHVDGEGR